MKKTWCLGLLCLGALVLPREVVLGQYIYWVDAAFASPTLNRSDTAGGSTMAVPLNAHSLPEGIAIDAVHNTMYFGELAYTQASVYSVPPDLSSITPVRTGGSAIRGVAVDPVASRVYWTTSNLVTGATIESADPGGANRQTVYQFTPASGANLRGIAVDGTSLYWADFASGKILRGDTAGNTAPEDLIAGLSGPAGIALDGNGYMYWTEANAHMIRRRGLVSGTVTTLVSGLSTPNYIAVDGLSGQMYWTEIGVPRIRRADLNGANVQTLPVTVTHPTGIAAPSSSLTAVQEETPLAFALEQNYPNPFNPSTAIAFEVGGRGSSQVALAVYDLLGREVALLVNEPKAPGKYRVSFDGRGLASGAYFYRLTGGSYTETRKLLLLY
jgi:sugar lactone lactonase YvrE